MSNLFKKRKEESGSIPPRDVSVPEPIAVATVVGNRLVPFHDLSDPLFVVDRIVDLLQDPMTALANKYLYLGPHGASCWETVETSGSFSVKRRARDLLHGQLGEVLERCVPRESGDSLDVVSLGTGTGHDDEYILEKLWERSEKPVSLFALDLSVDLLRRAMRHIKRSVVRHPRREQVTNLRAFCIDIENLSMLRDYFVKYRSNERRLYHLLGLTLGNNDESQLLANIAAGMAEGDFLLIAVDFCLDRNEWRAESVRSYSDTEWQINDFLTCPLKTAVSVQREHQEELGFAGMFVTPAGDRCDFLEDRFRILKFPMERADETEPRLSDIPGSLSLARYYVPRELVREFDANDYKKRMRGKLCDFSNKYSSGKFEAWITREGGARGLQLMNRRIDEWSDGSQHLVLLKKTRTPADSRIRGLLDAIRSDLDIIWETFRTEDRAVADRASGLQRHFEPSQINVERLTAMDTSALERKPKDAVGSDVNKAKAYLDWAESLCEKD